MDPGAGTYFAPNRYVFVSVFMHRSVGLWGSGGWARGPENPRLLIPIRWPSSCEDRLLPQTVVPSLISIIIIIRGIHQQLHCHCPSWLASSVLVGVQEEGCSDHRLTLAYHRV